MLVSAPKRTVDIWNSGFFQEHAARAVRSAFETHTADLMFDFAQIIDACESPLEAAFAAWWHALMDEEGWQFELVHQQSVALGGTSEPDGRYSVTEYRVDLRVSPRQCSFFAPLIRHEKEPRIAVELDGHEFHEQTKEQVALRNRRDRDLIAAGWVVLHFSGTEFHRSPETIVRDVYRTADARYSDVMKEMGAF